MKGMYKITYEVRTASEWEQQKREEEEKKYNIEYLETQLVSLLFLLKQPQKQPDHTEVQTTGSVL